MNKYLWQQWSKVLFLLCIGFGSMASTVMKLRSSCQESSFSTYFVVRLSCSTSQSFPKVVFLANLTFLEAPINGGMLLFGRVWSSESSDQCCDLVNCHQHCTVLSLFDFQSRCLRSRDSWSPNVRLNACLSQKI